MPTVRKEQAGMPPSIYFWARKSEITDWQLVALVPVH
jgi:hypothetical protein